MPNILHAESVNPGLSVYLYVRYQRPSPKRDRIRLLLQNPDNFGTEIAKQVGCSVDYVCEIARRNGLTITVRKELRHAKRAQERVERALFRAQEKDFYARYEEEFRAYDQAKHRCTNPNAPGFEHWGGRGIKFLYASKRQFIADVGRKPSYERTPGGKPVWTLDRKDNDGPYAPGNCRWATYYEQARNRRPRCLADGFYGS